ncbi:Acid phosphatase, prostate, variant 2 [Balamuthia mandrillaris]
MSAECILLGVYPPGTGPFVKNQPALPYGIQPVPIHTIPRPDEIYLLGENYCPTYNQRLQKEHQTKEWQTLFKNNAEFLTYLSKMTGASVSLPKFYDIYDALYVLNVHHKLTLNISEETLQRVEDLANTVESINHRWDVLGNLGASPLINETLYHMNKVISGDDDAKKYIHWSGHDVTLMSVASAYQLDRYYSKFNIIPTYASAFALELYQEDDGENPTYSVRLLFKLGNETDFTPYVIPGCSDTICNMDLYTKAVKTNAIVGDSIRDWCKECGNYFAEACRSNDSRSWASSTPPQIGVLGSFRE